MTMNGIISPARRSGGAPVRRSRARRRGRRCMIRTFRNRLTSTRQQEHTMTEAIVNNGVNVGALLAAREALKGAPQAAKFTWRASCKWKNGTHSVSSVQGFYGLGQEQQHKTEFKFEADHPEIFASEDLAA